ncbi:hypothetical protein [Saccharopolyspora sp. NPDC002376]
MAAYLVTDTVVDAYLSTSDELTKLEQRVFAPGRDDVTPDLYSLKREVLEARDAVEPLLPVAHRLVQPNNGETAILVIIGACTGLYAALRHNRWLQVVHN